MLKDFYSNGNSAALSKDPTELELPAKWIVSCESTAEEPVSFEWYYRMISSTDSK